MIQAPHMIQAPFGSTTQAWPGVPSPLAWSQPPMSAPASPMVAQGLAPSESMTATGGWGPSAAPWGSMFGGAPVLTGALRTPFTIPEGVTAPVLMAAVAFRRGLPQGPGSDHDVEELIYDALELIPSAGDVEVRCEGGRVTLSGNVPHKRIKHDVGELAWAIPVVNDVQNTVTITGRRRSRAFGREAEQQAGTQARKQS
jgi:BON domain-containing protein